MISFYFDQILIFLGDLIKEREGLQISERIASLAESAKQSGEMDSPNRDELAVINYQQKTKEINCAFNFFILAFCRSYVIPRRSV